MNLNVAIEALKQGKTITIRAHGKSMQGKIEDGDLVTISPVTPNNVLKKCDIVICKVKGKTYLHLIKAIKGERYLICNNKGWVNGWCGRNSVYGRAVSINR